MKFVSKKEPKFTIIDLKAKYRCKAGLACSYIPGSAACKQNKKTLRSRNKVLPFLTKTHIAICWNDGAI
jgi:hypothetical protein